MAAARKANGRLVVRSDKGLNLRMLPALTAKVIRVIPDGEKVAVVTLEKSVKGWKAVMLEDGSLGWVMADYLTESDSDA